MDKFFKIFFSMKMMTLGLFIFLAAIGTATFIESMYDMQTARIIIYNSIWFEFVLAYLCVNLIANVFDYNMFRREKAAVLSFHLSFIIIMIGAAVTRYYSFDGMMEIREGEKSNTVYSSDPYLWFKVNDGKLQYTDNQKMFLSEITDNEFSLDVNFPNHKTPISIEYVNFQRKMIDSLIIHDSINGKALDIITDGMKSNYVTENGFLMLGGNIALSFDKEDAMPGIHISEVNGQMMMKTKLPMRYLPMSEMQKARQSGQPVDEKLYVKVPVDTLVPFKTTTLYMVGDQQFVFKQVIEHAKMMKIHSGKDDVGYDYLTVKITDGKETKIVELGGGIGMHHPEHVTFEFAGLTYEMEYGSMAVEIPFQVACRDFQLDKYPGSEAPSSFASEVTIVDAKRNYSRDQRIFMNHVMDYRGYRFFQSSYDVDNPSTPENEEGTILSVNQDWWGTNITYLGYMFMMIGMVLSLFSGSGRFKDLIEKSNKTKDRREALSKTALMLIVLLGSTGSFFAQDHEHNSPIKTPFDVISKEHATELESVLVLSYEGRIVPLHTCFDQILRKIYRNNKYENLNAVQTMMSMHMYPKHWASIDIIQVPSNVREKLKLKEFASFMELTDKRTGEFKWLKEYGIAHKKSDAKKDEFDKKLIKLGEKYQVLREVFDWRYMKLIPSKKAMNDKWFVPLDPELSQLDSTSSYLVLNYIRELYPALKNDDYSKANLLLNELKKFQRTEGIRVAPSEGKVKIEITYNKMNIFANSLKVYIAIGLILLTLFFMIIFIDSFKLVKLKEFKTWLLFVVFPGYIVVFILGFLLRLSSGKLVKILRFSIVGILLLTFLYHGTGLGFRWYITGYAPWNNGYGAIVFIAWIVMLIGFIFSKKHPVILAAAAILSALMLFVTEMNLMDPEITPIVPVLKSYWLMIHVAIITSSYGFLGLGCILGLINLVLYITRENDEKLISIHVSEITYISEMIIILGIFMLTIGTFLGGIWANESWGRYWAWDPKEVWALVSILVYAVILHLRYIPGLSGKFLFNVLSFWGYSAILFTYFGVNYYLKGLHSYAQGDGLGSIPIGVQITIAYFGLLTLVAIYKNHRHKQKVNESNLEI